MTLSKVQRQKNLWGIAWKSLKCSSLCWRCIRRVCLRFLGRSWRFKTISRGRCATSLSLQPFLISYKYGSKSKKDQQVLRWTLKGCNRVWSGYITVDKIPQYNPNLKTDSSFRSSEVRDMTSLISLSCWLPLSIVKFLLSFQLQAWWV